MKSYQELRQLIDQRLDKIEYFVEAKAYIVLLNIYCR